MNLRRILLAVLAGLAPAAMPLAAQDLAALAAQRPLVISGSITSGLASYSSRGIDARQKPFSWQSSGTVNISIYGVSLPFSFTLSEKERKFRQPFDQFGLSPTYRWLTLHGGYRSPAFSPLVFAGQSMLCWGLEMNPWLLRTGFVQGRFQRAVAEDTLSAVPQTPAFKRTGYAAKLGFGSADNFTDVALLKARDDASSLPSLPVKSQVLPGENVAFGVSSHYRLFGSLALDLDAGYSAYTRDQRAPSLALPGNLGSRLVAKFLAPNASTQLTKALQMAAGYRWGVVDLAADFKRIDPEYRTMGIAYLSDDVQSWGGRIGWTPLAAVRASAGITRQRDNLGSAKKATTYKTGLQSSLSYGTGTAGVDLSYGLAASSQTAGSAPLNDSTALSQSFHTIGIAPRLMIPAANGSHTFAGSYLYQFLVDGNAFTRGLSQSHGTIASLSYTLAAGTASVSLGTTLAALNTSSARSRTISLAPSASLSFWQRRLALSGNAGYSQSYNGSSLTGRTINSGLSSQLRPGGPHAISASVSFTRFMAHGSGQSSFSEVKGDLSYVVSF